MSSTIMESGKFVLRITPDLHKTLKAEAKERGESLNSLCLKKLAATSNKSWGEFIDEIITVFNPLGILLFGSYARGENSAESDIDLLIVLDQQKKISKGHCIINGIS
ncbi:MAG: toxin-antitoxin system HicB family antitoxin [Bdellovibrionales bacterium]|nr:toxin-antitoxin system HicB family antitoxin [Bdellovibrionales bacterium]